MEVLDFPNQASVSHWNRSCENQLNLLGQAFSGGLICFRYDAKFSVISISSDFLSCLGYTDDELIDACNGSFLNAIHEADRKRVAQDMAIAFSNGDVSIQEYRMYRQGGHSFWVRSVGCLTESCGRQIVTNYCIDLSALAVTFCRAHNQSLARLADTAPCGICKIKPDRYLTILEANSFFYSIFGYTPQEAAEIGISNAFQLIHSSDFTTVWEKIQKERKQNRTSFELEARAVHKNGKLLWIMARYTWDPLSPDCLSCFIIDITERKHAEEQIRLREEENRIAFENMNKRMVVYDIAAKKLLPKSAREIERLPFQWTDNLPDSVLGKGIVAEESEEEYVRFYKSIHEGVPNGECVLHMKGNDGLFHWYAAKYTLTYTGEKTPLRAVLFFEDITDQREKELAYQKWRCYFELQRPNSMGYYEYNLTKNRYDKSAEDLPQKLPDNVRTFTGAVKYFADSFVYEKDVSKYYAFYNRKRLLAQYYAGKSDDSFEYRRKKGTHGFFWSRGTVQLIPDPYTEDIKAFILVQNIDVKKQALLKIQQRIERDAMTGVLNRDAVVKKISRALQEGRHSVRHALIMLDIDFFKHFNDTFGHLFGDKVLRDIAAAIERIMQSSDLCGRMGSDEFILFFKDIPSINVVSKRLETLCFIQDKTYENGAHISISAGAAIYPDDGTQFEALYKKADAALYEAKKQGRSQFVIYHSADSTGIPAPCG